MEQCLDGLGLVPRELHLGGSSSSVKGAELMVTPVLQGGGEGRCRFVSQLTYCGVLGPNEIAPLLPLLLSK